MAGRILLHRDQRRRAAAFEKHLAHPMSRRLRGDQRDVDVLRRFDRLEPNVEPVSEHQHLPGAQMRGNLLGIDPRLRGVRGQQHDHVSPGRRLGTGAHGHSCGLGLRLGPTPFVEGHLYGNPAVLEIERVRMPL